MVARKKKPDRVGEDLSQRMASKWALLREMKFATVRKTKAPKKGKPGIIKKTKEPKIYAYDTGTYKPGSLDYDSQPIRDMLHKQKELHQERIRERERVLRENYVNQQQQQSMNQSYQQKAEYGQQQYYKQGIREYDDPFNNDPFTQVPRLTPEQAQTAIYERGKRERRDRMIQRVSALGVEGICKELTELQFTNQELETELDELRAELETLKVPF